MLHEYSHILQLHTPTYLAFKQAPDGLARALQLFFIVTLIAGIGVLFGIPVQAGRMVLAEGLDEAQGVVDTLSRAIEPFLNNGIPGVNVPPELSAAVGEASAAAGETLNALLATFETEAALLEPPLGTTASRIIRQFGRWLATPFAVMGDYLGLALAAMLAAKLLGGRATLSQHLTAVLLAAAPLVLLLPAFIPDMSSVTTLATAAAIGVFGRLIALVALAWAAIILIKGLALAHEFSWERAAGSLLLAWLAVTLLLPALGVLLLTYLFRP
jgi:hypothetical protein